MRAARRYRLLANTIATGGTLIAIILAFGPISGADRTITMGCDVEGVPRIDDDWWLPDPKGQPPARFFEAAFETSKRACYKELLGDAEWYRGAEDASQQLSYGLIDDVMPNICHRSIGESGN